jgi:hypothetical protein
MPETPPDSISAIDLARKVIAEGDRHSRECRFLAEVFIELTGKYDELVRAYYLTEELNTKLHSGEIQPLCVVQAQESAMGEARRPSAN